MHPPSPSIRHCIVHHRPSPLCSRSIAAAIAPTLAVEEPLRRPLPSRSRCTVHYLRRRGAIAPSLAIKEPSRHLLPLPSRRHCAVPRHRGAVAPSLAIEEPSRRPLPSPSMSHRAVPRCRGAVEQSIAVKEPSRRPLPSRSCRPAGCHVSSLLKPPPPICRRLRLSSCRRHLLSRPSRASRPAG